MRPAMTVIARGRTFGEAISIMWKGLLRAIALAMTCHKQLPIPRGRMRPKITVIARVRTFGEAIPFAKVEIASAHTPGLAMTMS